MKKIFPLLLILILSNCIGIFKKPEFLFVQSADSASFDGKVLALYNTPTHTIYFSNGHDKIAGHIKNSDFLKSWNEVEQTASFIKHQPNAAISFYDKNGVPAVVIAEISNLKMGNNSASYEVKILKGTLPPTTNLIHLFIDNAYGMGVGDF